MEEKNKKDAIHSRVKGLVGNGLLSKFNNNPLSVDNEMELNNGKLSKLVIEGLANFERGLKIIGKNIRLNGTRIPILGVDVVGRLVILEVFEKEEELILLKIIDHFDWVFNHMEDLRRKFADVDIDISLSPRIMIILPGFSQEFLRRITYFSRIDLRLYIYRIVNHTVAERFKFELVSFSSQRKFSKGLEEKTIDELVDYIENSSVRVLCRKALQEIKRLFPHAVLNTANGYISFRMKERELFGIYPRQNFFWFNLSKNVWRGICVCGPAGLEDVLAALRAELEAGI